MTSRSGRAPVVIQRALAGAPLGDPQWSWGASHYMRRASDAQVHSLCGLLVNARADNFGPSIVGVATPSLPSCRQCRRLAARHPAKVRIEPASTRITAGAARREVVA